MICHFRMFSCLFMKEISYFLETVEYFFGKMYLFCIRLLFQREYYCPMHIFFLCLGYFGLFFDGQPCHRVHVYSNFQQLYSGYIKTQFNHCFPLFWFANSSESRALSPGLSLGSVTISSSWVSSFFSFGYPALSTCPQFNQCFVFPINLRAT